MFNSDWASQWSLFSPKVHGLLRVIDALAGYMYFPLQTQVGNTAAQTLACSSTCEFKNMGASGACFGQRAFVFIVGLDHLPFPTPL